MLELTKAVVSSFERLSTRSIYLFTNSRLFYIEGNWEWSFQTPTVFCSEVLFFPNGQEFECSFGLILPKDNILVREWVLNLNSDTVQNFGFHIITSYGKLEWLKLTGLVQVSEEKEFFSSFGQEQLDIFIRNKKLKERSEREQLYLKSYELVEKVCDAGMWTMNSTTFETFYSDSVYRIHGLAPQSLNAHFHTFTPFIHPEDEAAFTAAFESAYKSRMPLQLEYRLLLNRTEIKYIRLSTKWSHSYKGEEIITGIIEDLTLEKSTETKLLNTAAELKLRDNMSRQAETMGRMVGWRMDLLTRKIVYSHNIYRLYGLKPTGQPLRPDFLLKYVHPEDRDVVVAANAKISKENPETYIEFRIIRPDGKIRYLAQKSRVLISATGDVIVIGTIADVSASVNSEKKLMKIQADQELQRIAFEQMEKTTNSGSWFRDIETGEQSWSNGMYDLLGFKQGDFQLSEKMFLNLVYPEDRKLFASHLDIVINGGTTETEFDFCMLRKGETRYLHAKFALLKTGERLLFSSTLQDRTEERHLQQHLTEQLRMANILSDASMNKVFVCDNNNNIIRWNKWCEEAYGVKKEKLMGKNFFDVFPRLKTAEILGYFERVSRGETIDIKDQKAILTGGYQDVLMVPIRDEKQKIIATLIVINDTTKAFEMKQQLTERLRFIEKLLEESVDRVIVLDHHMNYQYWNRRAEEHYGIKKEKILGKNILEVFPGFINDPSYLQFRQALHGETVFVPDSGSNRATKDHFEAYLIPFKDDKGIVTGILWIVHDLTKDRQLQQQQVETFSIIDALSEGYYKLDKEFRVVYINPSAEKFFNSSKENFIGKILWDAVPGFVGGPIYKALIKAMEDKESVRGEYYSISACKWVFLSVTPTVDGILVMFFDIQKQKDDEHFIQLTVDTSPNMIGVNSLRENKWIYVNRATEKFFGYTNEEINGMGDGAWASLVHTDDIVVVYELVRKVVASQPGTIHEAQYRALRKDGEYRWLFNRSTVFKTDEEGRPTEVLCIAFDNTEKVQADEKLKESKDWLRSVLDNAGNSIMALKPVRNETGRIADLEYLFVNDKAAASVNRWDLVGKRMAMEFPGSRSSRLVDQYIKVIETGEPWSDEVLINYDGFENWAHSSCSKFGDGCLVTYEDITELKKRELELKETKDMLQSLSDASIDRILAYDCEFRLVSWNRRCEEIYGLNKEAVLGKSIFDFYPKFKEDTTVMNAMMQALKGESVHLSMRRELYCNRMSEMFYIPVKGLQEEVSFVLVILHDISKMYEAQEELKMLNKALVEKNRLLEQKHMDIMNFSFIASHDLMEPVRKGTFFTNLLLEKESAKFSPAARAYVQKISNSMKRMNALVGDILLLTELHSKEQKKEPVHLGVLLEQVKIENRDLILSSGAEIETEVLPVIEGNRKQLLALFKNLIDNSIKFQNAGTAPRIRVTVELMEAGDISEFMVDTDREFVKISFADNGIGIDQKNFKKVFEIFRRLHNNDEYEGTGIGLAICKKAMENHGGFITVQSERGKGSSFNCYFLLP